MSTGRGFAGDARPVKIVILGEGRVGKTSLLRRYVEQTFDETEASSSSATYLEKRIVVRGQQVQLSLWDTAGQERFHSLAPIYYRDAEGAVLVYDVTDIESFRRVAKWVEELNAYQGSAPGLRGCSLAVIGNKSDLKQQVRIQAGDAEAYAKSIGGFHNFASAKMGFGVEDSITRLADNILASRSAGPRILLPPGSFDSRDDTSGSFRLVTDDDGRLQGISSQQQKKRGCKRGCCGGGTR